MVTRATGAVLAILALAALAPAARTRQSTLGAQGSAPPLNWYKGNTHTHTLNSDGDSSPDDVARWYREHGYHFLVLSDHNFLTSTDGLNALLGADERFLIIPGEEATCSTWCARRAGRRSSRRCNATSTPFARQAASRTSTIPTSGGPSPPPTSPV
ncbi:MAG: hypothetical protein ABS52_05185 [Gemmatimonadetes bacterium SCN 70-22]|nr:MAG: hypothetical protein ABS52_05185 [Gemmatimonadetes bacterium SCN 70-22]